jgi:ATP-dependent Clp protease ATP-binding subunit ClpC
MVFERFNSRARRAVVYAQEIARGLNQADIRPEHLLAAILALTDGVAFKALAALDIKLDVFNAEAKEILGQPQGSTHHIPFDAQARKVLELSLREALALGHSHIGTEHLLLGIIRHGECEAARFLVKAGADLSRVRPQVTQLIADGHNSAIDADHGPSKGRVRRWFRS